MIKMAPDPNQPNQTPPPPASNTPPPAPAPGEPAKDEEKNRESLLDSVIGDLKADLGEKAVDLSFLKKQDQIKAYQEFKKKMKAEQKPPQTPPEPNSTPIQGQNPATPPAPVANKHKTLLETNGIDSDWYKENILNKSGLRVKNAKK